MSEIKPFGIRVNGQRTMRVIVKRDFQQDDDWYYTVDVRDNRSTFSSQAIIDESRARDRITVIGTDIVRDAVASAYLAATKTALPARFSIELTRTNFRTRYGVFGRNGYWPIDSYRPDDPDSHGATHGTLILPRLGKSDAERVASALNEAFAAGEKFARGGE